MTSADILHKLYRVNQTMLQIARAEKPTGDYPNWAVEADIELTMLQREFRLKAKAEAAR